MTHREETPDPTRRPASTTAPVPVSPDAIAAGLPHVLAAPRRHGTLELIVRRPAVDRREVLAEGELDPAVGLVGDTWDARPSRRTPDLSPHPDMQLTLINVRFARLIAGTDERVPLAGDQLYVDLDLGEETLPVGSRIAIGGAVVEVTEQPHTGCAKFSARFGKAALTAVSLPEGRARRLRGLNARVVVAGVVHPGDRVEVLSPLP